MAARSARGTRVTILAAAVIPRLRRAITLPKNHLYPTPLLHSRWALGDGHEPYRPERHHQSDSMASHLHMYPHHHCGIGDKLHEKRHRKTLRVQPVVVYLMVYR